MGDLVLGWTPLPGGIVSLDQDYRPLIGSYDDLIGILVRDTGRQAFLLAFKPFLECAGRHFSHGELVMRNISYGGYLSHKAAHDRLRADGRTVFPRVKGAYP